MATRQEFQAMVAELAAVKRELTAQSQRHTQGMDVLRQENAQRLQEVRQEATQAALGAQGMVPAIQEMGQAQQTALKEAVQDSRKEKTDGVLFKPKGSESQAYTQVKLNSSRRGGTGCPATSALCIQAYKRCWNGVKTGSKASPQKNCRRRSAMKLMRWIMSSTLPRKAVSWLLHCMVTQKEPVAIVINCGTSGFEAWRWLTRRYDPATASRKRTMLKTVISPQKQKLESLPRRAIEEWMDAVRTYEKRRDAAGNRTSIPDEIKTAALEAMLPHRISSLMCRWTKRGSSRLMSCWKRSCDTWNTRPGKAWRWPLLLVLWPTRAPICCAPRRTERPWKQVSRSLSPQSVGQTGSEGTCAQLLERHIRKRSREHEHELWKSWKRIQGWIKRF